MTTEKFFCVHLNGESIAASGDFSASFGDDTAGAFASWQWDGETLTLINDRYGFFPLFYITHEQFFAVSPSVEKLLEFDDEKAFDHDAMSVFLRLGWLTGDDTIFKSIRAVPPGSKLEWSRGELRIESAGMIKTAAQDIPRRAAIERYAGLFDDAVRLNAPDDRIAVPLSGGRDSRHVLLALWRAKHLPEACLTLRHPPPRPNEDARIAAMLCERIGQRHEIVDQSGRRFDNEIEKNRLIGFGAFEHGWFLSLGRFVAGRFDTVYDGIAGDVLSAGLFLTKARLEMFHAGRFEDLADHLLESEGYLPALASRRLYRDCPRDRAIAHLSAELRKHADEPNPVGSFFFWNRTRRCIAASPLRLIGGGIRVVMPFLDTPVYDFLASLRAEFLIDQTFHTDTIRFAYPEFEDIPYERKDSPPNLDAEHFNEFAHDIFRFAMSGRNRALARRSFFATRFLRGIFDRSYNRAAVEFGEQAINLLQIERL